MAATFGYNTTTIGSAAGRIVSGTKTVTTAGTAVQVTATTTPIIGVFVSADAGNTNEVVVGDSSVVAANGTQQGLPLFGGNPAVWIPINDLSLLWVDSVTNGDELCYLYLEPAVNV